MADETIIIEGTINADLGDNIYYPYVDTFFGKIELLKILNNIIWKDHVKITIEIDHRFKKH